MKRATDTLVEKVTFLVGVSALGDLRLVVEKLTEVVDLAERNAGAEEKSAKAGSRNLSIKLLSSVPAVGLRGAAPEAREFCRTLEDLADRHDAGFQVICYDQAGRDSFYREERGLTDDRELKELLQENSALIEKLRRRHGARVRYRNGTGSRFASPA